MLLSPFVPRPTNFIEDSASVIFRLPSFHGEDEQRDASVSLGFCWIRTFREMGTWMYRRGLVRSVTELDGDAEILRERVSLIDLLLNGDLLFSRR